MVPSTCTEKGKGLSRRSFVQGSALAASLLATGSLAACAPQKNDLAETNSVPAESEGEWIAAACWNNCGGRCVNRVLMKDNAVVRMGSDTSHEDSYEWIQRRGCVRGRAQQQICFGADRLRYPMKRKGWQPGGGENAHGDLRGKDEWERISWDEAIDYIAQEINRIYDEYGPEAVLGTSEDMGPGVQKVLAAKGGFMTISDTDSFGTYSFNVMKLGLPKKDISETNDRFDLKNAETIVQIGGNSVWSSGGSTMRNYKEAIEAGVQFVMVGPSFNPTAAYFQARWIPVLPGTDTAFFLGVAHEMIKQDVVDYDFLNTYCLGFDADHMPDNATTSENFKDYLMGAYDGQVKDAVWASAICGTPVEDIEWFAGTIGKDHKVMLFHNYAMARCHSAENIPQLLMTIGAMGGHMGKSGHACGGNYKTYSGTVADELVMPGESGLPEIENPVNEYIQGPLLWESVLSGEYNSTGNAYSNEFNAKTIKPLNIKMVSFESCSPLANVPGTLKGIEAIRTVDFVLTSAFCFNTEAQYSDIVLPITTQWETVGGFPGNQRDRETLFVYTKVTEPLFEAKTDQEIGCMLAEKVGIEPASIWPISETQQFMNTVLGCTFIDENGDAKPLVTVTADDLASWECEGEAQEGVVELAKFLKDGVYSLKRSDGDAYSYIGYEDFVKDPENNPRDSESGKFEIYCQYKSDTLNSMGYGPADAYKPYPNYVEAPFGREGMFADRTIGGEPSEYPFILFNTHYYRSSHRMYGNSPWLREAWVAPVFLNASDAAAKGIKSGDTVRIYNQFGATLRRASVLETIMPGCVSLPHGGWLDYDEEEEVDRGGMDNVLCGGATSGMAVAGYNNYNCDYELYTGEELEWDFNVPSPTVDLA